MTTDRVATVLALCSCLLVCPASLTAADLKPDTVKAFDEYIGHKEAHLRDQVSSGPFLWADQSPGRKQQLREEKILTESSGDQATLQLPDGLIHDWLGAVFIPGVTVQRTLNLVQQYEHHAEIYQPEVIGSKILEHNGMDYKILLRLKKQKVLTVVLNTEHAVHYERINETTWRSRSYSTHIAEVENPGKADEHELPVGKDHGFLWRLDSYCVLKKKTAESTSSARRFRSHAKFPPASAGSLIPSSATCPGNPCSTRCRRRAATCSANNRVASGHSRLYSH